MRVPEDWKHKKVEKSGKNGKSDPNGETEKKYCLVLICKVAIVGFTSFWKMKKNGAFPNKSSQCTE